MTSKTILRGAAMVAALIALGAGGVAISSALDSNSAAATGTATNPSGAAPPSGSQGAPGGPMMGGSVTGAAADKAKAAALAKYSGTVEHVTKGPNGGYVVHVIRKDGSEVHVLVSSAFKVTGVDTRGPGAGGGRPPSGAPPTGQQPPSGQLPPSGQTPSGQAPSGSSTT